MTSGRSVHGSTWLCSVLTLPNARAHLADLHQQAARQRRERDEALLDAHLFAEGEEEVGARVGIDDRLKRRLGFVQLEGRLAARWRSDGAEEVADHRDVGIEDLGRGRRVAVHGQRAVGPPAPSAPAGTGGGGSACAARAAARVARAPRAGCAGGGGRRRLPFERRQARLERGQPLAVFGAEGLDRLPQLLDLAGRDREPTAGSIVREPSERGRPREAARNRPTMERRAWDPPFVREDVGRRPAAGTTFFERREP